MAEQIVSCLINLTGRLKKMSDKVKLLQKIKTLVERGVDGEKESAERFLSRLMKKYGITQKDLSDEKTELQWFRYHDDLQHRLLRQIIYMIMGDIDHYKAGRHKLVGVYCTPYEHLEIEANYEFFKNAIKQEIEVFYTAFCQKNRLFPPKEKSRQKTPNDEITEKELLKIHAMMDGMERFTLRKIIEN